AGLIKAALSLHHEEIPAHLHLRSLNPLISLSEIPAEIPTTNVPWSAGPRRRFAGISSFGFSGTNAHAVLEEAPPSEPRAGTAQRPRHVLALSAKTPEALRALAGRYEQHLGHADPDALADLCFTANVGRSHFEHRIAVTGASVPELREAVLRRAASIGEAATDRPRIAFLFTGQGSQYIGMAQELNATQPIFAAALTRCDELYRAETGASLLRQLYPSPDQASLIDETGVTQPALFAVEYALSELWGSWGIVPDAVIGHSVGELVAACVAGMMSLEDAFGLTVARARLMQSLPAGGAMAAIATSEEKTRLALAALGGELSIAAVNGPDAVVISGEAHAVDAACRHLEGLGIASRPLTVSHAFHSPLMDPILDALEAAAARVNISEPRIAIASNVTGRILAPSERCTPQYWRDHARGTVRFADGMRSLAAFGCSVFIELGPTATLASLGRRTIDAPALWIASLKKGRGDWEQIASAVAQVYESGADVDWTGFDRPYSRRRVTLPTYAFQRERYWIEDRGALDIAGAAGDSTVSAGVRSPIAEIRRRCAEELPREAISAGDDEKARGPGSSLGTLERGWRGSAEALGEISVAAGGAPYRVHASLFECCAMLARAGLPTGSVQDALSGAHRVAFTGTPGARVWGHVRYRSPDASGTVQADVALIGDDGAVLGTMEGLQFTGLPAGGAGVLDEVWTDDDAYEVAWRQSPSRQDSSGSEWRGNASPVGVSSSAPVPLPPLLVQQKGLSAPVERSNAVPAPLGLWLVLVDRGGLGSAIAERLAVHGAECLVARAGDETSRGGDGRWTVDPAAPDAFDRIIAAAAGPLRGVVHCFSLDATPLEDATAASLDRAGVLGCGTLLHVTQAVLRARIEPRVWVVTRDAVAALPADTLGGLTQTPAWGFGRVLALEHPELWGGLIDVATDQHTRAAARVVDEILAPEAEDQIALRPEGRLVPRLVPARPVPKGQTSLRRDGSYLVTGGT
ncbi:MAG: acyltransferase domain-containing protein, partial [Acidobacteriota bacterium]